MSTPVDIFTELSNVFIEFNVTPKLKRTNIVPSLLYDMDYNIMLSVCAFCINSTQSRDGVYKIDSAWLKLLAFVAARPTLAPSIKEWARIRRECTLASMLATPRGYLGDKTQDATIQYLVAKGNLKFAGNQIEGGDRISELFQIMETIKTSNMLGNERSILYDLANIRVTHSMMEAK